MLYYYEHFCTSQGLRIGLFIEKGFNNENIESSFVDAITTKKISIKLTSIIFRFDTKRKKKYNDDNMNFILLYFLLLIEKTLLIDYNN